MQLQNVPASHTAQTYTPFALLTGPQCIPVCCAATMTTPAHVPVTAWTYPAPCGAPGVQLIPCCDAPSCTNRHISAPRQFLSRPNAAVGIGPYHYPSYRHHHHHHHHSRHRLPTPSLSGVPVPLPGSVYQPNVPSSSMVAPPSVFSSQQQGPSSQTVYRGQQVSHSVYQSSALINRAQQVSFRLSQERADCLCEGPHIILKCAIRPNIQSPWFLTVHTLCRQMIHM